MLTGLLLCSFCESVKKDYQPLGEFLPDGSFIIERYHKSYTKISARELMIFCGNCNRGVLFIKNKEGFTLASLSEFIFKIFKQAENLDTDPEDLKRFVSDMLLVLSVLANSLGLDLIAKMEDKK